MDFLKTTKRLVPIAALLIVTGCGDEDSAISLVPVKGTITMNGEPLANAQIAFVPDPSNKDQTPGGDVTGPAGTYLARFKSRSGLAPGKYKVKVAPPEVSDVKADSVAAEAFKDDPFMLGEMRKAAPKPRSKRAPEPEVEFDAQVEAGGSPIDYDVKRSASAATAIKQTNAK
ncbi:carboxypeptidase-like regulatory domain-containing protein [Paludisphaera rhizosphaerae]|uniref:carboxypeptidase-like regulatory domain-containing protein n=1 Tax=Paludisphaera rhizosphaerae TaxID=2711216 RepID=UPI0013EA87EE|nr:carboxypeptidase-like regulatory domain-containing protein [Paludisphaera rhizosphaerae]